MKTSSGQSPTFLGKTLRINLPKMSPARRADLAKPVGKRSALLNYTHYSSMVSQSRKLPVMTITDIDGTKLRSIRRKDIFDGGSDKWLIDPRIPLNQWGMALYDAPGSDFDRGHMTKREYTQWGDTDIEAANAARDTFYFTNCAPQVAALNQRKWAALETYVLHKEAVKHNMRLKLFTGPVLNDNDPVFTNLIQGAPVQIPTLFWKVIYFSTDGVQLKRVGFLMGQEKVLLEKKIAYYPGARGTEDVPRMMAFADKDIYQVNVSTIEHMIGATLMPANEPYTDVRPQALIVNEVQVPMSRGLSSDTDSVFDWHNIVL
jgi:endonuclease G, mitochondrial